VQPRPDSGGRSDTRARCVKTPALPAVRHLRRVAGQPRRYRLSRRPQLRRLSPGASAHSAPPARPRPAAGIVVVNGHGGLAEFVVVYLRPCGSAPVPCPSSTICTPTAFRILAASRSRGRRGDAAYRDVVAAAWVSRSTEFRAVRDDVGCLTLNDSDESTPTTAHSPAFCAHLGDTGPECGYARTACRRCARLGSLCLGITPRTGAFRGHAFLRLGLGITRAVPVSAGAGRLAEPSPAVPDYARTGGIAATLSFLRADILSPQAACWVFFPAAPSPGVRLAALGPRALPPPVTQRWTCRIRFGVRASGRIAIPRCLHSSANRPGQVGAFTTGSRCPLRTAVPRRGRACRFRRHPGTLSACARPDRYWARYDASRQGSSGECCAPVTPRLDPDWYHALPRAYRGHAQGQRHLGLPAEVEAGCWRHDVAQAVGVPPATPDGWSSPWPLSCSARRARRRGRVIEYPAAGRPSRPQRPRRMPSVTEYPPRPGKIRPPRDFVYAASIMPVDGPRRSSGARLRPWSGPGHGCRIARSTGPWPATRPRGRRRRGPAARAGSPPVRDRSQAVQRAAGGPLDLAWRWPASSARWPGPACVARGLTEDLAVNQAPVADLRRKRICGRRVHGHEHPRAVTDRARGRAQPPRRLVAGISSQPGPPVRRLSSGQSAWPPTRPWRRRHQLAQELGQESFQSSATPGSQR